jgi:signal transduction histidine kinase
VSSGRDNAAAWVRRWRDAPVRDVAIALVMTAVTVGGAYGEAHPSQPNALKAFGHHPIPSTPNQAFLLVAVAGLALAWRRKYPLTVLAVSTAAVSLYSLLGFVNGAALLSPAVALYAAAAAVSARRAVVAAGLTLVALMASTAAASPLGPTGGGFFLIPALVAAATFGGIALSSRRAYVASIRARAEDEARRRVDEERLRIARELHDVVAHTMSTINVQASAASAVLTDRPQEAARALAAIRAASKDGLRELRAILKVLRQADEADPTTPAPGLDGLDALIANARQAGLPVTLRVAGQPAALPAEVDLAAYRIVQESLTNSIRHAGPATASVSLSYTGAELLIEVADTGRGPPHATPQAGQAGGATGHGIIGMRERAAAVGGSLRAGPGDAAGFVVTARLPLARRDDHERATPAAVTEPATEGARR